MRRVGQNLLRATAVEPPTLPVPPSIRTLEVSTFSGSWTLSILVVAIFGWTFSLAEATARFLAMPAFNCRQNLAIFVFSSPLCCFPQFISLLSLVIMWACFAHSLLTTCPHLLSLLISELFIYLFVFFFQL